MNNELLPNLISSKTVKYIDTLIITNDKVVPNLNIHLYNIYNNYLKQNLFPLILISFVCIILFIKYLLKKEKDVKLKMVKNINKKKIIYVDNIKEKEEPKIENNKESELDDELFENNNESSNSDEYDDIDLGKYSHALINENMENNYSKQKYNELADMLISD
jgi:hypothetical protein